jgi:hypothetical protein
MLATAFADCDDWTVTVEVTITWTMLGSTVDTAALTAATAKRASIETSTMMFVVEVRIALI